MTYMQQVEAVARHFGLDITTVMQMPSTYFHRLVEGTPRSAYKNETAFTINGRPVSTQEFRLTMHRWLGAGFSDEGMAP